MAPTPPSAGDNIRLSRIVCNDHSLRPGRLNHEHGPEIYTVDANGNLVARSSDSFAADQANRLTSATIGGTTST